eukprot:gnl/MRDRNA2_/MRDRNA2_111633_c0_seq1.p1 gnl/MRDRNA2_/MRDRNA2_111633_c0~~gnl/MRDRNA2_/MRDRNA2_111633_c0_seq1.p1  ORF type:complete len:680 (-),score=108.47 gnl/MRDRNA2_/MRDRNA2_111633_c0_seq1:85-2124(-)
MITPSSTIMTGTGKEPVPLEVVHLLMRKWKREDFLGKLLLNLVFVFAYAFIVMQARPVKSTFTALNSILQHTADEAFPLEKYEKTFYDIANPVDWWEFVDTVLIDGIMPPAYFNSDLTREAYDGRFQNTIAQYNTLMMPVRFRQVRVLDDSCGIPSSASQLSRPCWGDFTPEVQYKEDFGLHYGNTYLEGLSPVQGKEGFGVPYGTAAHVVDVRLDSAEAKAVLGKMKEDLWLNEQTRAISIEAVTYNANLDLSVYVNWHMDISASGRFTPYVTIYGLRLEPYGTTWDLARLFVEIVFSMMLLHYIIAEINEIRYSPSKKAYFSSLWNVIEIVNLFLYCVVLAFWFTYIMQDRKIFMRRTPDEYTDLKPLAIHFNFLAKVASFNVIFAFIKIFKYLQVYPSCSALWRTLALSMADTIPFGIAFMLFTCGFTFAAHWCFGYRMKEFHSLLMSFSTLIQTMGGALPYDEMKRVSPVMAPVFLLMWIFVMGMVLINMFVAIISGAQALLAEQVRTEEEILTLKAGEQAQLGTFTGLVRWFQTIVNPNKLKNPTIFDADASATDVRQFLRRKGELRMAENIHQRVMNGERIQAKDITDLFHGDLGAAIEFVSRLHKKFSNLNSDPATVDERESMEQQEIKELRRRVEKMQNYLTKTNAALNKHFFPTLSQGGDIGATQITDEH